MKKIFSILIAMLFVCVATAQAQEGSGSCVIRGTANDYVHATAYLQSTGNHQVGGTVSIANSSSKPLLSFHLTVKCDRIDYVDGEKRLVNVALINQDYHPRPAIGAYDGKDIPIPGIRAPNGVENVTVTISNATCN
ncbi:MAG: hypothetical protein J1F25_07270 [Prevotellaceae bacterium]|nr:hypothetical protein [Prevotellaceae bacterium]